MAETAAVALVVVAAALWVGWTIVLPARIRRNLLSRVGRGRKTGGCDDCG